MTIFVDSDHTWDFDNASQTTAPNYIHETVGFVGLLAMDFSVPMPTDVAIDDEEDVDVSFAAQEGKTAPTLANKRASYDRKKALADVDCTSATPATWVATVGITTTDGQVVVRQGRLVVT